MITLFGTIIAIFIIVLAIPTFVFSAQCLAALFYRESRGVLSRPEGLRVSVVIPAHNEEAGIEATLQALRDELSFDDRVLVVADNCSDRTVELARAQNAEVIERKDPDRRGKGYALAFALEHLAQDPPDLVVILDADCRLQPGSFV